MRSIFQELGEGISNSPAVKAEREREAFKRKHGFYPEEFLVVLDEDPNAAVNRYARILADTQHVVTELPVVIVSDIGIPCTASDLRIDSLSMLADSIYTGPQNPCGRKEVLIRGRPDITPMLNVVEKMLSGKPTAKPVVKNSSKYDGKPLRNTNYEQRARKAKRDSWRR